MSTHKSDISSQDAEKGAREDVISTPDAEAHVGVATVEAANKVYGKYSKWMLFIRCVVQIFYCQLRCISYSGL